MSAAAPLHRAGVLDVAQPLTQQLDAMANEATVRLQLRLTRSAHPDPAAEFLEVGPHPRQSRAQVFELGQLDLHLRLTRSSTRGEDVENQLSPVHDTKAGGVFDVASLRRRQ